MLSNAQWIWPKNLGSVNTYARFEDLFVCNGNSAVAAHISVSGEYVLEINGQVAGFGQFGDWPEYKTFNIHDITSLCVAGENFFRLLAWQPGLDCSVSVAGPGRACFWLEQDGKILLSSGADTPCAPDNRYAHGPAPLITGQLGYSFAFDANQLEASLAPPCVVAPPRQTRERPTPLLEMGSLRTGELCAQGVYFDAAPALPPASRMRRAALSMRFMREMQQGDWLNADSGDGIYLIYDLGQESVGYLDFELDVDNACEILIGFGEHLVDLRVRTEIGHRGFSCIYRAKPEKNIYTHYFRRWGCRYIQLHIPAKRVKIGHVGLIPVVYPVAERRFECSDRLHTKIHEVAVHTLRSCMHDHYEDCPWREQALYAMDSRIQMLCGYYAFAETALPKACLRLLAGGLREDGLLELCAPAKVSITIPCFSLAFVVELWEYVLYSGDLDVNDLLETALTILSAMDTRTDKDGCVLRLTDPKYWNFYEWQPELDGSQLSDARPEGPLTAWYALALEAGEKLCRCLGQAERADVLARRHAQVLAALERFWDDSRQAYAAAIVNGRPAIYAELMQALTLLSGACPKERAALLRDKLAHGNDWTPVTLNDALLRYQALLQDEARYADFVFDDIAETWGKMLFAGATTFWETALGEADFDEAGSLCHGWSAVPVYFYHAYGKGLRPDTLGEMSVHPVYQTRLGKIR